MDEDDDSWSGEGHHEIYPADPVARLRPPDRRRSRLAVFAYSMPNKVGSFLAGLCLFVGLIAGPGLWLVPTMFAFWAIGVLITPRTHVEEVVIDEQAPESSIRSQLDALRGASHQRLPHHLHVMVESICRSIEQVLPRTAQARASSSELYTVHETVLRYLPDALNAYFALPPGYAHRHRMSGGRTADQVLGDQLALLDREMRSIVASLAEHDAQALAASERFLQARFGYRQL